MKFRVEIEAAALTHQLDPDLVQGVVEQESTYRWYAMRFEQGFWTVYLAHNPLWRDKDPHEVSSSYGLMQIMFVTAVENGFKGKPWELLSPAQNLDAGCRYLAQQFDWAHSAYKGPAAGAEHTILMSALAAYNGGKKGNLPDALPDRNRAYAVTVWDRVQQIKNLRT